LRVRIRVSFGLRNSVRVRVGVRDRDRVRVRVRVFSPIDEMGLGEMGLGELGFLGKMGQNRLAEVKARCVTLDHAVTPGVSEMDFSEELYTLFNLVVMCL